MWMGRAKLVSGVRPRLAGPGCSATLLAAGSPTSCGPTIMTTEPKRRLAGLLLELLHPMLLVVEHRRRKRIIPRHAQMRQRSDHGVFVALGKDMTDNASFVAGVGDLRYDLPGADDDRGFLRPQGGGQLRRQFNFERD